MFDYIRLIKKSIKSHTLFTDCFGYGLVASGFADKYLAGLVTMYKNYYWLSKRYRVQRQDIRPVPQKEDKDYVWICWLQGLDNAPEIVKHCYDSIQYWLKDKEIIVITAENYSQYVEFPQYIIEKWEKGVITNTHFSDLLRLELLIRYGGLWLDATTYFTDKLPEYIEKSDFFVYRNGWMDMEMINMGSWFIFSRYTNNILLLETRKLLYEYWSKMNYMKNYFLLHMFFRMVTDVYQEEWSEVPMINQIDQHFLMNELDHIYNQEQCKRILDLSPIHKLTYKIATEKEDITAQYLDELYKCADICKYLEKESIYESKDIYDK